MTKTKFHTLALAWFAGEQTASQEQLMNQIKYGTFDEGSFPHGADMETVQPLLTEIVTDEGEGTGVMGMHDCIETLGRALADILGGFTVSQKAARVNQLLDAFTKAYKNDYREFWNRILSNAYEGVSTNEEVLDLLPEEKIVEYMEGRGYAVFEHSAKDIGGIYRDDVLSTIEQVVRTEGWEKIWDHIKELNTMAPEHSGQTTML